MSRFSCKLCVSGLSYDTSFLHEEFSSVVLQVLEVFFWAAGLFWVVVLLILAVAPCILLATLLRIVPSEFPLYPSNSASLCFPDQYLLQQFQFLRHSMTNFLTIKALVFQGLSLYYWQLSGGYTSPLSFLIFLNNLREGQMYGWMDAIYS